jgi:copper chaperone CopZ
MTYYVHNVPGRLRVKIPSVKGRPMRIRQVREALEALEGIEGVTVNDVTGSVVVHYDEDFLGSRQILRALQETGYLDISRISMNQKDALPKFSTAGAAVGKAVFGWALGRALKDTSLSFLTVLV